MLTEDILLLLGCAILGGFVSAYGSLYLTVNMRTSQLKWNPWTVTNFLVRLILIHGYILLHQTLLSLILLGFLFPLLIIEFVGVLILFHISWGLLLNFTLFSIMFLKTFEF